MKRFTCTDKWDDKWHFGLSQTHKLAWAFLNDRCDHAGIFDMAEPLIAAYVGDPAFTLEAFAKAAGPERIRQLPGGQWWLPKFIGFQNANGISATKKPHQPAIRAIMKFDLPVAIGNDESGSYADHNRKVSSLLSSPSGLVTDTLVLPKTNVTVTSQEKEKEKGKGKERGVGKGEGVNGRPHPSMFQPTTDEVRVDPWEEFRKRTGLTRENLEAFIDTIPEGKAFSPASIADAYILGAALRSMHVWGPDNSGKPLNPLNVRPDVSNFVTRKAVKDPSGHKLLKRVNGRTTTSETRMAKYRNNPLFRQDMKERRIDPDLPFDEHADPYERSMILKTIDEIESGELTLPLE